jgi:ERCC4-type nuclease
VEFAGLAAGDYCLREDAEVVKGRELRAVRFSLERKSLSDMAGTLSSGWTRFEAELMRMQSMCARIVLVEGDFSQCCFHVRETPDQFGSLIAPPEHGHPMVSPEFLSRRIAELSLMQVSVLFCGNAGYAAAMALHIFRRRKEMLDGNK